MPKFIKTIHDRIQLLNRKGLSPYYSPDQIVEEVHAESLNIWKKYIQEFEKSQLISVYLDPLRGKETIALTSGVGTLVNSIGQYRTGLLVTGTNTVVDLVDIAHWGHRASNSITGPETSYPIARIDNDTITVLPNTVASVDVYYIKTPTKPVYAYTVVNDDYIYSDGSSVDFEWPEVLHSDISDRVMAALGLSQREASLIQYSNTELQKEGQ